MQVQVCQFCPLGHHTRKQSAKPCGGANRPEVKVDEFLTLSKHSHEVACPHIHEVVVAVEVQVEELGVKL